ncbi:MAG: hypothetical protein LBV23_02145 [Deltaproteobacteria bacterium]|jgi:transposase|nr:hypothetical protein [Deltaproteobacteria bacterium]
MLKIYRRKDIIEKGFDDLKNYIDIKRIQTYNNETTNGKFFCSFIALIAASLIAEKLNLFNKKSGRRHLSKQALISELKKIRVIKFNDGEHLMNQITKKQRDILNHFGFEESELISYASCVSG